MNLLEIIFVLLLLLTLIRDSLENLTGYFLNNILNANFFGDLKSEHY